MLERKETRDVSKKAAYLLMAFLAMYVIARGLVGAAALPFWFDEFFTLTIAGQPTVHDMWAILRRGFDTQPPLFYLIERLSLSVPIKREIALRLPSILAFPCILTCVFAYVKRSSDELIAALCAFLLLSTSLFHTYMVDARPYAMAVACMAFALVCYQRLPSSRWNVMFALSLILAESLHYYAVCTMIPFWLAEGIRLLRTTEFRWRVWLALVSAFLPLIPSFPLLLNSKAFYGAHFFALPTFSIVTEYYGAFFSTDRITGLALLVVSVTAIAWLLLWRKGDETRCNADRQSGVVQGTLLLGLNLLPFVTFVLARMVHGGLLDRYVLATIIGMVLGVGCALSVIRSNAAVALLGIFVLASVGLHEQQFWRHSGDDPLTDNHFSARSIGELAEIRALIESGGHPDLPVVFDEEVIYCQIIYYSPEDWARRLVFLTDEGREIRYENTDTAVRIFKAFHDYFPLQLADYTEFTLKHPEFLLYSGPKGWDLPSLHDGGASMQVLNTLGARTLFLVNMRDVASQPTNQRDTKVGRRW